MSRSALAMAALALSGCAEPGVLRVVDGREVEGHFISARAYAFYARGAEAEARGDAAGALHYYEAAASEDGASSEIWVRIGALRCRSAPPSSSEDADAAFTRAARLDPDSAPLAREQARCLLAQQRIPEGLAAASRAVELDPDDDETAALHAEALVRAGRAADARRELEALAARRPGTAAPWLALLDLARKTHDVDLAHRAARHAGNLRSWSPAPHDGGAAGPTDATTVSMIDEALRQGDLREARRRALRAHMPAAELAIRAAALGVHRAARDQAEFVLGANAGDVTARIALAAAADLAGDTPALSAALASFPAGALTPPSPLARLVFAELLLHRVDADAARAWLGPPSNLAPPNDPLLVATERRVRAALGHR